MFTTEQKTWITGFLAHAGVQEPDTATEPAGVRSGDQGGAGDALAFLPIIPIIPVIPGVIKSLTGPLTCICKLTNNTTQTLQLDLASVKDLKHGEFKSFPPATLAPKQQAEFTATSSDVLGVSLTGVEGFVRYLVDDQGTAWTLHFDNPRRPGGNAADATVVGPGQDKFDKPQGVAGPGADSTCLFVLSAKGGGGPGPGPGGTATEVNASCLVTVTNATQLVLTLAQQGHVQGDFMTFPPASLQPGASCSFVSVQTPHGKAPGCKGFLLWDAGTPAVAAWRLGWDNAVGAQNTALANLQPQNAGFRSLEQIGQGDENVPVAFTLSGGPPGGQIPGGNDTPPGGGGGQPEPPFEPPAEARQPTLRKGDKSPDGWVEYLQELLNFKMKSNLAIDGDFGGGTLKAVHAFQKASKLMDDGVVGNQTWAALRDGAPEKPSTDGRKPHSYEEHGKEARWTREGAGTCAYDSKADALLMLISAVGDTKIDGGKATVRVTPPGGKAKTVQVVIGPSTGKTPDGQGEQHTIRLDRFKQSVGITDPAARAEDCLVEAYLDKELGGDLWKGHPVTI